MTDTRSIALNMLLRVNEEGAFGHLVMRETFAKLDHYETRDKAFIKRLTEGTLEQQIKLDYIIDLFSKVPIAKMKPLIRNLLRMSVYQIIFMTNVPDRAACDEAVKLAAKRGFSSLKGFVNGILRNIVRQKETIALPNDLSISYSMPEWLVEKWLAEYGYEKTESILRGLIEAKPITVRLHKNAKKEEWLNALKAIGAKVHPHPYLDYAYELSIACDISNLPGFKEGFFIVQDVSSMLVCEAAGIGAEDTVVDVCAAPGGKALHAAKRARKVIARDLSTNKCKLIEENKIRLQQKNIEISVHDASVLDESLMQKADILLADLPCSGLGVIGKKPDIKYKINPESISALSGLQRWILSTVWQYVKPGGILIYSTCTMTRDENENMMEWFVENFPFTYDALPERLVSLNQPKEEIEIGILKLLPGIHQTDGFFICRLRREDIK